MRAGDRLKASLRRGSTKVFQRYLCTIARTRSQGLIKAIPPKHLPSPVKRMASGFAPSFHNLVGNVAENIFVGFEEPVLAVVILSLEDPKKSEPGTKSRYSGNKLGTWQKLVAA
ncbi:BQ5605_C013g07143 [Microbotryum silenes-dioicae]|uniref:BQ5605_C013g07143 protein n=1 Tax=Microbotryum silenes-dioicae TaxID=796604 RepID=A0A2X0NNG0_9BASI|nr:BQ5605_C013g07143 [Microbotryum silenes-dioicae]